VQPKVIPPIDQGRAALELLDEIPKEVLRLVGVVDLFDGPFGRYAAVVCLFTQCQSVVQE